MPTYYSPLVKYPDIIKMTVVYDNREVSVFIDRHNLDDIKLETWKLRGNTIVSTKRVILSKFIMNVRGNDELIGYQNGNSSDLREINLCIFNQNVYKLNENSDESILEIRSAKNPIDPTIVRFTTSDYEILNKYIWYIGNRGYPMAKSPKYPGKTLYLHLVLLNRVLVDDGNMVDHIDRNPCNSTRPNLRIVNASFNCRNKTCTSKYGQTGITWDKSRERWIAFWPREDNPKLLNRRYFPVSKYGEEEAKALAIEARLEYERSTYGYINSPTENSTLK